MNAPPSLHRYPNGALMSEAAVVLVVLMVSLGLSALFEIFGALWLIFMAAAGLCVTYLAMLWLRASSQWVVSDIGIEQQAHGVFRSMPVGPFTAQKIDWTDLTGLRLKYFATRRDQENGWFELTLVGPRGKITLHDSLTGFDAVLRQAAAAAEKNGVPFNEVTRANIAAFNRSVGAPFYPGTVQGHPRL